MMSVGVSKGWENFVGKKYRFVGVTLLVKECKIGDR